MRAEIEILNPVFGNILKGKKLLAPCLSYVEESMRKGQYRMVPTSRRRSFIKGSEVLVGFVPRIKSYCEQNRIGLVIRDVNSLLSGQPLVRSCAAREPRLEGVDIRAGKYSFQYPLIQRAIGQRRGIIKAATASGKTVIMAGIISAFPESRVLFLANTHVPISQFKETLAETKTNSAQIDVSTIQSFHKKDPKTYVDKYDIILIDEAHDGLSSMDTMYAKVLQNSLALMRLGFTATMPDSIKARMTMEGLLGPVIGEFTIQEGMDREVLAKPKIVLKMIPENSTLRECRSYREAYEQGVVKNRALNRQVVKDAIEDMGEDGVVLILVLEIIHGINICQMARDIYGKDFVFVQGNTESDARDQIRHEMKRGGPLTVVATAVFRKALNVPALDSVILALGGKSDTQTLQALGRGLRKPEGKDTVIFRDYFIPSSRYLVSHFGHRLTTYFREGWL